MSGESSRPDVFSPPPPPHGSSLDRYACGTRPLAYAQLPFSRIILYRVDTRDVSDKPKLSLRDNASLLYLNTRVSMGKLAVLRAVFLPTLVTVAHTPSR